MHHRHDGRLHAFAGYTREIDVWAGLFDAVTLVAPCREGAPPGDCLPFARDDIALRRVIETGGATWSRKVRQVLALPILIWQMHRALRGAGTILVRCPGNLGLLGAILAPLHSRRVVAKYAGQWQAYPGEPWTERLQRRLLASRWWPGPVLVYGVWPNQPSRVMPLSTSILTAAEVNRARRAPRPARRDGTLRILCVNRLVPSKNTAVLIAALGRLERTGVVFTCTIVGEGPERPRLEAQVADLGLGHRVTFAGGLSVTAVLDHYESADVMVRASEAEGWPKVIAEAMAFGLVCIGSDRGLMPWMLGEGRGLVVPPRDPEALAGALERVARDPRIAETAARATAAWRHYSAEDLRDALRGVLGRIGDRR